MRTQRVTHVMVFRFLRVTTFLLVFYFLHSFLMERFHVTFFLSFGHCLFLANALLLFASLCLAFARRLGRGCLGRRHLSGTLALWCSLFGRRERTTYLGTRRFLLLRTGMPYPCLLTGQPQLSLQLLGGWTWRSGRWHRLRNGRWASP